MSPLERKRERDNHLTENPVVSTIASLRRRRRRRCCSGLVSLFIGRGQHICSLLFQSFSVATMSHKRRGVVRRKRKAQMPQSRRYRRQSSWRISYTDERLYCKLPQCIEKRQLEFISPRWESRLSLFNIPYVTYIPQNILPVDVDIVVVVVFFFSFFVFIFGGGGER